MPWFDSVRSGPARIPSPPQEELVRLLQDGLQRRTLTATDVLETISRLPQEARQALAEHYQRINKRTLIGDFADLAYSESSVPRIEPTPELDAMRVLLAADPRRMRAEIGIEILERSGRLQSELPRSQSDYSSNIQRFMSLSCLRLEGEKDAAANFVASLGRHWPDEPAGPKWKSADDFQNGLAIIRSRLNGEHLSGEGIRGPANIEEWLMLRSEGDGLEAQAAELLILARLGALDRGAMFRIITELPPADVVALADAAERVGKRAGKNLSFAEMMGLPAGSALEQCLAGMKKAGGLSYDCDKLVLALRYLKALKVPIDIVCDEHTKREPIALSEVRHFYAGLSPEQRWTLSVFPLVNYYAGRMVEQQRESFIKREVESQGRAEFLEWVSSKERFVQQQHSRYARLAEGLNKEARMRLSEAKEFEDDTLASTVDEVAAFFNQQTTVPETGKAIAAQQQWQAEQAKKYFALLDEELRSLKEETKTFREFRERNIRAWVRGGESAADLKRETESFHKLAAEYRIVTEAGAGNFVILPSGKSLRPVEAFMSRLAVSERHTQELDKAIQRCDKAIAHLAGARRGLVIAGGLLVTIQSAGAGSGVLTAALSGTGYSAGVTGASATFENAVHLADKNITPGQAGGRILAATGQAALDQAKVSLPVALGVRSGYRFASALKEMGRTTPATPLLAGARGGLVAGASGNAIANSFQFKDYLLELHSRPENERTPEFRDELLRKHRLTPARLISDFAIDTYAGGLMGSVGVATGGLRHAAGLSKHNPGLKQTLGFGLDFGAQLSLQVLHQGAKTGRLEVTTEQIASSLVFATGVPLLRPAEQAATQRAPARKAPGEKSEPALKNTQNAIPFEEYAPALNPELISRFASKPLPAGSERGASPASNFVPTVEEVIANTQRKLGPRPPQAANAKTALEQVIENTEQRLRVKKLLQEVPRELLPKGAISISGNNRAIFLESAEQVNQLYIALKAKQLKALPQYRDRSWAELADIAKAESSSITGAFADLESGVMILPKLKAAGQSLRTGTLSAEQVNLRSLAVEEWAHLKGEGETQAWAGRLGYANKNRTELSFENGAVIPKLAPKGQRPAATTLEQINEHLAATYSFEELTVPGRFQRSAAAASQQRGALKEIEAPLIIAPEPPRLGAPSAGRLLTRANELSRQGVLPGDSLTLIRLQEVLAAEYEEEIRPYVGAHGLPRTHPPRLPPGTSAVRNPQIFEGVLEKLALRAPDSAYAVVEENGKFFVSLPSLSSQVDSRELKVSMSRKAFGSEAEAIAFARMRRAEAFERQEIALYDIYVKHYDIASGVKRSENGQVVVTFRNQSRFELKTFSDWSSARAALDQRFRYGERLGPPLLEMFLGEGMYFTVSSLADFKPRPRVLSQPDPLPPGVFELIAASEYPIELNNSTYLRTIANPSWQKNIFSFVEQYLNTDGKHIKSTLGISDLRALTPEQATKLSVRIVEELFKFNLESAASNGTSREDLMSTLEILQEGLLHRRNPGPQWKGNGVCRNAADSVKAIFETLKGSQHERNLLLNTYCLLEAGWDYELSSAAQNPEGKHAWNSFVSLTSEGIQMTVVDATWTAPVRQDNILGLNRYRDYTRIRALPAVMSHFHAIEESPELAAAALKVHEFIKSAYHASEDINYFADPKYVFPRLAKEAIAVSQRAGVSLDAALTERILFTMERYPDEFNDSFRMEVLRILSADRTPDQLLPVCRRLFATISYTEATAKALLSSDPKAQAAVLLYLRQDTVAYAKLLSESPSMRALVRKCSPTELPEFDPTKNAADFKEFGHYIRGSLGPRHLAFTVLQRSLAKPGSVLGEREAKSVSEAISRHLIRKGGDPVSPDRIRQDWLKYSRELQSLERSRPLKTQLALNPAVFVTERPNAHPAVKSDFLARSAPPLPPSGRSAEQSVLVKETLDRLSLPSASIRYQQARQSIEALSRQNVPMNKAEADILEGLLQRWSAEGKFSEEELETLSAAIAPYVDGHRNSRQAHFARLATIDGNDATSAGVLADRLTDELGNLCEILTDTRPGLLEDPGFELHRSRQYERWKSFLERSASQLRNRFSNKATPRPDYYTGAECTLAEKLLGVRIWNVLEQGLSDAGLLKHLQEDRILPPSVKVEQGAEWAERNTVQLRFEMLCRLGQCQKVSLALEPLSSMMSGMSVRQRLAVFEHLGNVRALDLSYTDLAAVFEGMSGAERLEAFRSLSRVDQLDLKNVDLGRAMQGMIPEQRLEMFRCFSSLSCLEISICSTVSLFTAMSPGQKIQAFKYLGQLDFLGINTSNLVHELPGLLDSALGMSQLSGSQQLEALQSLGNVKHLELWLSPASLMCNMSPAQKVELFRAWGKAYSLTFGGFPFERMLSGMSSTQQREAFSHLGKLRAVHFESTFIASALSGLTPNDRLLALKALSGVRHSVLAGVNLSALMRGMNSEQRAELYQTLENFRQLEIAWFDAEQNPFLSVNADERLLLITSLSKVQNIAVDSRLLGRLFFEAPVSHSAFLRKFFERAGIRFP